MTQLSTPHKFNDCSSFITWNHEWVDHSLCCTMTHPPPKNPCTHRSNVSGTWETLGNVPKLLGTSSGTWGLVDCPQDIPSRFQGRFRQISGMLW